MIKFLRTLNEVDLICHELNLEVNLFNWIVFIIVLT